MFNNENKKTLEEIYDMVIEQGEALKLIYAKLSELTTCKVEPKIGIEGLAEILGCSKSTAAKRLKSGKIPYDRHGNIYQFDEKQVRDALRAKKRPRG